MRRDVEAGTTYATRFVTAHSPFVSSAPRCSSVVIVLPARPASRSVCPFSLRTAVGALCSSPVPLCPSNVASVNHLFAKSSALRVADTEIESSLYRWRASGEYLKQQEEPFWLGPINMILRDE